MNTFVVRVWAPAEPTSGLEPGVLRGVVEHVGTERSVLFVGGQELLDLLTERTSSQWEPKVGGTE